MSLWDALRMNMMISYQELVRTFLNTSAKFRINNVHQSHFWRMAEANAV
jgi:hypothetical protein